jgi:putative ABC transport system permease protein
MSPQRLAWRTLLQGRPRSVLAVLIIAAALCGLDLLAGHNASTRARLEYQAIIGDRLGHLAIWRAGTAPGGAAQRKSFDADEAARVRSAVLAAGGVALLMPQNSVSGLAATSARSALFDGQGVGADDGALYLPGKLDPARPGGIAVSTGQARALGLRAGSSLTLTAATADAPGQPVSAEVVDVYASSNARAIVLPFPMAQALLDTERVERFVVFLHNPAHLEDSRRALLAALAAQGIRADIRTWREQSATYARARANADLTFDSVAGMAFAVIAAAIAATISMNALERRREVATLRALGMRASAVFLMYAAEALMMALTGLLAGAVASGLVAWVVNRLALPASARLLGSGAPMLVELDGQRMFMAVLAVMAVALLAVLVPAFKAARAGIAESLV